jgi:hypothetical protein
VKKLQLLQLTKLKKIKNIHNRWKFGFADIESMNHLSDKFRCGSICWEYKRKVNCLTFFDEKEYFAFLFSHFDILYFFNLGYDINYVQNYVYHNTNYQLHEIASQSMLLGMKIVDENNDFSIIFKDIFPFCQTSLKFAMNEFNTLHKKFPNFDYMSEIEEKEAWEYFFDHSNNAEIQKHCENDCYGLKELFDLIRKEFFELFSLDCFAKKIYSSPSFFMNVFRSNFLFESIENPFFYQKFQKGQRPQIIKCECNGKILFDFVQQSYKGGYCNCESTDLFFNLKAYDISSAYPFGITAIRFPSGKCYFTSKWQFWKEKALYIPSIAKVEMYQKVPLVCILENNKLVKKVGKFTAVLTSFEIFTILRYGGILYHFYEGLVFDNYDKHNSLAKYERFMYKRKCSKKGGQKVLAKLGCNSIYGKFGQKYKMKKTILQLIRNEEEYDTICFTDKSIKQAIRIDEGGIIIREQEKESIKAYFIILWSSLITAFVRIYLLENAYISHSIYEDTDSLKIEAKYEELLQNKVPNKPNYQYIDERKKYKWQLLGFFDLEETLTQFRSLAPKVYAYSVILPGKETKKVVKLKGVPKMERDKLFQQILDGKTELITDIYWKILKPKESLRRINVDIKSDIFGGLSKTHKKMNPIRKDDSSLLLSY